MKTLVVGTILGAIVYGGLTVNTQLQINALPDTLKLQTDKTRILGEVVKGSEVKYAYRSDQQVETIPAPKKAKAEVIEKRTSHSRTFTTDTPNQYVVEIVSGPPQYYKDPQGAWWVADYATTTLNAFNLQTAFITPRAHAQTFYPDPSVEVSSVDGWMGYFNGSGETWATVRGASGNEGGDSGATDQGVYMGHDAATGTREISRTVFLFDTSSLGDGDTVTACTFSLYGNAKGDTVGSQAVVAVASDPASNTAVVSSDYQRAGNNGPSKISDTSIDISGSWSTAAYNDFTCNATGIAAVSKTSVTKFGMQLSADQSNTEPSWPGGNTYAYAYPKYSETAGTTNDPKLVVTVTVAATPALSGDGLIFE